MHKIVRIAAAFVLVSLIRADEGSPSPDAAPDKLNADRMDEVLTDATPTTNPCPDHCLDCLLSSSDGSFKCKECRKRFRLTENTENEELHCVSRTETRRDSSGEDMVKKIFYLAAAFFIPLTLIIAFKRSCLMGKAEEPQFESPPLYGDFNYTDPADRGERWTIPMTPLPPAGASGYYFY